jgi:hypothetical protein
MRGHHRREAGRHLFGILRQRVAEGELRAVPSAGSSSPSATAPRAPPPPSARASAHGAGSAAGSSGKQIHQPHHVVRDRLSALLHPAAAPRGARAAAVAVASGRASPASGPRQRHPVRPAEVRPRRHAAGGRRSGPPAPGRAPRSRDRAARRLALLRRGGFIADQRWRSSAARARQAPLVDQRKQLVLQLRRQREISSRNRSPRPRSRPPSRRRPRAVLGRQRIRPGRRSSRARRCSGGRRAERPANARPATTSPSRARPREDGRPVASAASTTGSMAPSPRCRAAPEPAAITPPAARPRPRPPRRCEAQRDAQLLRAREQIEQRIAAPARVGHVVRAARQPDALLPVPLVDRERDPPDASVPPEMVVRVGTRRRRPEDAPRRIG